MPRAKAPATNTAAAAAANHVVDEWAPPEDEIGLTLSQVLHRPSRKHPLQHTTEPTISRNPSEPVHLSGSDSSPKVEQQEAKADDKQIAAISAMFDDDDDDTLQKMDFMDEESATNYQRILANSKRERSERRRTFRERDASLQTKKPLSPPLPTKQPSASADELPDDPLAAASTLPLQHTTPSKRKRHAPLRICDSEASDDNDVLDERRILQQRLRTKPEPSLATSSRFEQARLKMERETYDSDSDHEDLCSIGVYDSGNGRGTIFDPLETDSEPERLASHAVMVIRDSSDEDDDFISDPEDSPPRPRIAGHSRASKGDVSTFISKFAPLRRRQMQNKIDRKTGNHQQQLLLSPAPNTVRAAKGYDYDLDDDIADFIVEDDDDTGGGIVADTPNGETSAGAYDSDNSARPRLSREGPRGVMALMPEEFGMFDLRTSFRAYVQYLVYWICNDHQKPVFKDTNAQYFFQAYIAVARVIDSVEQSVVASSAWVEPFRTSLHSYPDYAASSIAGTQGCDACHFHSHRTATFCVTLSGTPYKRSILAPLKPGEAASRNSEAESDSTAENDEEEGGGGQSEIVTIGDDSDDAEEIASEPGGVDQSHVDYNLGKTCKMRSEICHGLHHYFYHLAHTVEVCLETLDYESKAAPSMGGRGWEDAVPDDLVDMLEANGDTDKLFHQFKDCISRAKSGFTT
ncbi:hypothetical protein GGI20_005051 [Coemansia sp. BCRC 34301]|nr:hypothetical protein GGI20_005051 [Coemansia sp. BCRC 34301]